MMQCKVWNIVSAYVPQIGCEEKKKDGFWIDFPSLLKNIPKQEFMFIKRDLNGHAGKTNGDYEDAMEVWEGAVKSGQVK